MDHSRNHVRTANESLRRISCHNWLYGAVYRDSSKTGRLADVVVRTVIQTIRHLQSKFASGVLQSSIRLLRNEGRFRKRAFQISCIGRRIRCDLEFESRGSGHQFAIRKRMCSVGLRLYYGRADPSACVSFERQRMDSNVVCGEHSSDRGVLEEFRALFVLAMAQR